LSAGFHGALPATFDVVMCAYLISYIFSAQRFAHVAFFRCLLARLFCHADVDITIGYFSIRCRYVFCALFFFHTLSPKLSAAADSPIFRHARLATILHAYVSFIFFQA